MKLKIRFLTLFLASFTFVLQAQDNFWNGKKCAVIFTYDDALDSQLDIAIPLLDSLGFKATFFIPGHAKSLQTRLDDWRRVAAEGHELGNHTLFHPCHGKSLNRKWVKPEYDLDEYTLTRITDEIILNNVLLNAIDGKAERTFAYTCGDTKVQGQDLESFISKNFVAARGVQRGLNYPGKMDIYKLKIFGSNSKSDITDMKAAVDNAQKEGALLVFLFHGIGSKKGLDTPVENQKEILEYVFKNKDNIWVAPLVEVMEYYKKTLKND